MTEMKKKNETNWLCVESFFFQSTRIFNESERVTKWEKLVIQSNLIEILARILFYSILF